MDLYLVRHGLSEGNRAGRVQSAQTPLAPEGLIQADQTGRWLGQYFADRGTPPVALYSSDMRRAWQTAVLIGRHLGLDPQPEPDLRERAPGAAEGLLHSELPARFPAEAARWGDYRDLDWGWPGGETRGQVRARVLAALAAITARHQPGDAIVAVTHGGPIWAYLTAAVTGVAPDLTDADLANCSVTHVHFPPAGGQIGAACLLAYNQAGHLAAAE